MQVSMFMMADALASLSTHRRLTQASERICISAVLPYQPGEAIDESALYVIDAAQCPTSLPLSGRSCYIVAVGGEPEALSNPACELIVAKPKADFSQVLVAALRALHAFDQWHVRLTDELLSKCDLNSLCDIGSELMQHPITICDQDNTIIGNSIPEDEISAMTFMKKRSSYYVSMPEFAKSMAQLQSFRATYRTHGATIFRDENLPSEVSSNTTMYANIGKGSSYRGRIVVLYGEDEPADGDFQALDIFCDIVRTALKRSTMRNDELDRVFRTYFVTMLEGRARDDRLLSDSLRLWNWPRRGRFVCLWAVLEKWPTLQEIDLQMCYQIELELESCCAVSYQNGIACVALLGSEEDRESTCNRFIGLLSGLSSSIGISEEYDDVLLTDEYFIEAHIAAQASDELGAEARRFGDIALRHYHRHGTSKLSAVHFCDKDVKRLIAFRGKRKDYYEVLKTYLELNMNLLRASEALYVHRTTLFNYLKEIRSLIDADLDDPEARLRMLASFRIMALDEAQA